MTFRERLNINLRFLDTIDFTPYLETCVDVEELIQRVENAFPPQAIPEELQGFVFDCMNESDVAVYLAERYKDNWYFVEEVVVKNYIIQKSDS